MPQYKVKVHLDYPPHKSAEPGDVVDDIPDKSVSWLQEGGYIEPVEDAKPKRRSRKAAD